MLHDLILTFAEAPCIFFIKPIEQRLDLLFSLGLAQVLWISLLEKLWSHFHKPLGIHLQDITHILLGGENQFVIQDPFWVLVEQ